MEKKCFIIMPVSEPDGYAKGHFDRVYQYIIVPACRMAGFRPSRADDPLTNDTAWELVKHIIESEIVICDLSSKNSNVGYGFAIRESMNLPVVLIRDNKTSITFNIQEFGNIEYDESLRIDTVQKGIDTLTEVLTKAYANKMQMNSVLTRLGIGAVQPAQEALVDTNFSSAENQEESARKEEKLPVISPVPDYVGDAITQEEIDKLRVGEFLFHRNHGKGEIKAINKMAKDKVAKIQFDSGSKLLILGTSGIFRKIKE